MVEGVGWRGCRGGWVDGWRGVGEEGEGGGVLRGWLLKEGQTAGTCGGVRGRRLVTMGLKTRRGSRGSKDVT